MVEKNDLRVLVTDYSPAFGEQISMALRSHGFTVIGTVCRGDAVLELLTRCRPNLLVLDLTLPGLDISAYLRCLGEYDQPPTVLTTSGLLSDYTLALSGRLRAGYLIPKPCHPDAIAQQMEDLVTWKVHRKPPELADTVYRKSTELTDMVHRQLLEVGVPCHISGFRYLQTAITLGIREPHTLNAVTKLLYPRVARECGSSPARVERSIRHALDKAWTIGLLQKQFPYPSRPTNSEFIAQTADRLRLRSKIGRSA